MITKEVFIVGAIAFLALVSSIGNYVNADELSTSETDPIFVNWLGDGLKIIGNGSDANFNDVNVLGTLNASLDCSLITGGSDADYCTDLYGNGSIIGGIQNNTDAILNDLNVTGSFGASVDCGLITGGSDADYCSDGGGGADVYVDEAGDTMTGNLVLEDNVKIINTNSSVSMHFSGGSFVVTLN